MADNAPPSAPETNGNDPTSTASWEGDKMFNIYIYDYCFKRGYRQTALHLMREADILPDSKPPINARQGLLFEWWSVFWVLFTAKANGIGTDDALLYTQAQQASRPRGAPPLQQLAPGQVPPRINGTMPNPHGPPQNRPGPLANPYMSNTMANAQHMQGMAGRPAPSGQPNFPPAMQRGIPGPAGFPQQPNQQGQGPRISAVNGGLPFDPNLPQPLQQRGAGFPPQQGTGSTPTPYPPLQQRPPSTSEDLTMPQQSPRLHPTQVEAEFQKIPPPNFPALKTELNLADKDNASLTQDEKARLVVLHRQRSQPGGQAKRPMPNGGPGPAGARRSNKRNSTSPNEEIDAMGNSPPNKKPRRSPAEQLQPNQQPPPPQNTNPSSNVYPPQPGGSQPPQPGMGPPMNNGMRPPPQSNFQNMPGMNGMNLNIPGPGQGNMNMMGQMLPPNAPRPELQQYRQTLQTVHRGGMQQLQHGGNPSTGSPPIFGPPGSQQQHNQMSQHNKGGMLPPPAPSPGKDGSTNNKPDASPRNQTISAPQTPQQVPAPTPSPAAMLGQQSQQQQQQQQNQGSMPGGQPPSNPGASLLGQPLSGGQTSNNNNMMGGAMMFNQDDFGMGLTGGNGGMMEEFDASMFRPEGDINFERDFGQWFNPEDLGGGLDMK